MHVMRHRPQRKMGKGTADGSKGACGTRRDLRLHLAMEPPTAAHMPAAGPMCPWYLLLKCDISLSQQREGSTGFLSLQSFGYRIVKQRHYQHICCIKYPNEVPY